MGSGVPDRVFAPHLYAHFGKAVVDSPVMERLTGIPQDLLHNVPHIAGGLRQFFLASQRLEVINDKGVMLNQRADALMLFPQLSQPALEFPQ